MSGRRSNSPDKPGGGLGRTFASRWFNRSRGVGDTRSAGPTRVSTSAPAAQSPTAGAEISAPVPEASQPGAPSEVAAQSGGADQPGIPAARQPADAVSRETTEASVATAVASIETRPGDDSIDATPLATAIERSLKLRRGLAQREPLPRPETTRVMVVANQKGGVGKTTTAVNLATTLAQHGLRILVLDLDPQGNASTALSIDHRRGTPSTYEALVDRVPLAQLVQQSSEAPGLMVVPSTIDLAGAEIELVGVEGRERRLREAIHGFERVFGDGDDRFDYVFIDCPPSLGLLTLNALVAADELLLPIQSEYYALEGVGQLLETVELVRGALNPRLEITTVLVTMYDARTRLSAMVADEVRAHFGARVLRTAIPRSVRVSEAPSYGRSVMTYDPVSPGALSYLEAARELTGAEVYA